MLRLLRALVGFLILLGTVAVGALFALQNTTPVPLDLLLIQLPERTVSLWLLLALALGVLLGLLSGIMVMLGMRTRLTTLERKNARLMKEVDSLRRVGLADSE